MRHTVFFFLFLQLLCSVAVAFDAEVHEAVYEVALVLQKPLVYSYVTQVFFPKMTSREIAKTASTADYVADRDPALRGSHFMSAVESHKSCDFNARSCPQGECPISLALAASMGFNGDTKHMIKAMETLSHFLTDAHQPLHMVRDEYGGNTAKVQFDGIETNLHQVLDRWSIAKTVEANRRNVGGLTQLIMSIIGKMDDNALRQEVSCLEGQGPVDMGVIYKCLVDWAKETAGKNCRWGVYANGKPKSPWDFYKETSFWRKKVDHGIEFQRTFGDDILHQVVISSLRLSALWKILLEEKAIQWHKSTKKGKVAPKDKLVGKRWMRVPMETATIPSESSLKRIPVEGY